MSIHGLRIDVDTWRGTRHGVGRLLRTLEPRGVRGTWYFTLGPDNMGRHLWRLANPAFAIKMMRSRAASLYGWEILLRGTLWPGPVIGRLKSHIRAPISAGHEFGVHAWDHHWWQRHTDRVPVEALMAQLDRATQSLAEIAGAAPASSASPGWRCTSDILAGKCTRPFAFHCDSRATSGLPLRLSVGGVVLQPPQIPVDLPTYDELIGRDGVTDDTFNAHLLKQLSDGKPHVLTVHAESEGGAKAAMFAHFLDQAKAAGHRFLPLGEYLKHHGCTGTGVMERGTVRGRADWLAVVRPVEQTA